MRFFRFIGLIAVALCLQVPVFQSFATAAPLTVSGTITSVTTWGGVSNPVYVTADIIIQNGAQLNIQAGTIVYVSAGANIIVQNGALNAAGTSVSPIIFTSNLVDQGLPASPGSWGQIRFLDATDDANTALQYVTIRYGQGVSVNSASPTFNNLSLENNAGAAITIDLASSPGGKGNQAIGNGINAVVVPAGEILGNVVWGINGIPYLVQSGTVAVGQRPTLAALTPSAISPGDSINATLSGTRLGGVESVVFDNPGLSATIQSGATPTSVPLQITAAAGAAVGISGLTAQVAAGKIRLETAMTVNQSQPRLTSISPSVAYSVQNTVIAAFGQNFAAASVVLLDGVPLSTTFIDSTQIQATLPAQSVGPKRITVRSLDPNTTGSFLFSNTLSLSVQAPQISLAPASATVIRGTSGTLTVGIPYTAGVGGVALNLVSSVPAVASVPATITIPQGATSAQLSVAALADGVTTITASQTGFISKSSNISVIPPPTISVAASVGLIGVNRSTTLTVSISNAAGAGGQAIALTSSVPAVVTVPASITIPEGATSATLSLTGSSIGTATVSGTASGFITGSVSITVRAVSVNLPVALLVSPSLSRDIPILLSDPAPVGGLVVNLSSSNSAVATVTVSVIIPEGQTTANATLTGVSAGSATVAASATGYQSGSSAITVQAVTAALSPGGNISLPESLSASYAVALSKPAPAGGVTVSLSTGDATIATVSPSSVFIPEGQTSGGLVTTTINALKKAVTTLSITSPGLTGTSVTLTVTGKPQLVFSLGALTVGKGLNSYDYDVYVYRTTDNQVYSPATALTVSLSSADATKVGIPATVTIPANSYYTYFKVSGIDLTGATPVVINASAIGYLAPTTKLSTNVISPVLQYIGLDEARNTLSARDDFYVRTYVPGAPNPYYQTAYAPLTVGLSITDTGANLAPTAVLAASSIVNNDPANYGPQRAADGLSSSYNETNYELHPWWEADLGQDKTFDRIVIVPQSCCSSRNQYTVLVASTPFVASDFTSASLPGTYSNGAQVVYQTVGANETSSTITIIGPFTGRYVRVVYKGTNNEYLILSEVQLLQGGGAPGAGGVVQIYSAASGGSVITQSVIAAGTSNIPTVYAGEPTATGSYIITANIPGIASANSALQTVSPADLRLNFGTSALTVGKGLNSYDYDVYVYRTLNGANYSPATALTVSLSCASIAICTTPATVTIPANSYYVYFKIAGQGFGSSVAQATASGYLGNSNLGITVVAPEIRFNSLTSLFNVGVTNIFQARTYVTGASNPYNQTTLANTTINLTSASPGAATVTPSVVIPAGGTISGNAILTGVAVGTTSVTASGTDYVPIQSGTITVNP